MNNDLISRSALLADLQEYLNQEVTDGMQFTDIGEGIDLAMEQVKEAPAVDAEPVRHGKWIPQDNTRTKFQCSDCKSRNHDGSGKWCSNCGCKMDAEVEGC